MKMVLVKWLDAMSLANQWVDDNDVELMCCESIGFLIKEDKSKVVLAQNISKSDKEYFNKFAIPKGCIQSIRELK